MTEPTDFADVAEQYARTAMDTPVLTYNEIDTARASEKIAYALTSIAASLVHETKADVADQDGSIALDKLDEIRTIIARPLGQLRGGMDADVLAREIQEVLDR